MAHRIIHGWWTECSECGGGCGAAFDEPDEHRYPVWNGEQED